MHRAIAIVLGISVFGCAADAARLESDLVVDEAGPASPVAEGARCVLRMQPAWRQGVNCQVLLRCDEGAEAEHDLFGGRRIGGYAVCATAESRFLSARDEEPRTDGDPAIDVDLAEGRIAWRGPGAGETATLRVVGDPRFAQAW